MNAQKVLIILTFIISSISLAEEVCVVGGGFENEDGKITYTTGVGPDGATPRSIKTMNLEVKKILQSAAANMDASTQYCMIGKLQKNIFEVSKVQTKKLLNK